MDLLELKGYTDMTADLFHYGHVNFLKKAKEKCSYLVVGIHNNEDVEKYKRTPVLDLYERAAVVRSCKYVDEIILNAPVTITEKYLKSHNIDVVFTAERPEEELKMMYSIPLKKNMLQILPYTHDISTTNIIHRIKNRKDL